MLIGEDPKLDWKEFVVLVVLRESGLAVHEEVEEVFDDVAISLRKGESQGSALRPSSGQSLLEPW